MADRAGPETCEHGGLRRACALCDALVDLARERTARQAAEARATAAEAKLRTAEEALETIACRCSALREVSYDWHRTAAVADAALAALRSQEAPAAGADPAQRVAIGCWYRHRKGGLYVVEDVALESTNGRPRERVVVYRGTQGLNVRTEREFLELVDGEPRFALTSDPPPAAGAGADRESEWREAVQALMDQYEDRGAADPATYERIYRLMEPSATPPAPPPATPPAADQPSAHVPGEVPHG